MNTASYLLELGRPGDVAIVEAGGDHTYGDLVDAVDKLTSALRSMGLPPGSAVGVLGPNSFFWVAAYLAVLRGGHVAVPFSTVLTPEEVRRNCEVAHCAGALMDERTARRLSDCFGGADRVVTDDVLAAPLAHPVEPVDAGLHADAALMFTSGTTAEPKVVRLTHRNIQANTDSIVEYLGLGRTDRMLVVLPFSYVFGASLLHTHLRAGGSLVICNTFTFPETAVDMVEKRSCTGFAGVPSSFQMLLRRSTFRSRRLPSLRIIQQAGGKLPPVLIQELVEAQPTARVFVMYGASEATARMSYLPPEDLPLKLGSIGKGMPGVDLRVLDEAGHPVNPGETGEIYARGDNISPGYLDDPEATADKFPRGMFRTGDLATVDAEGYVYVLDRKDDFIKSWGHRVASQEIEAAVLTHPCLVSAAAVGVPDRDAGEAIWLFVTVNPGAGITVEDVAAHCRGSLPRRLQPKRVRILDEMPLNSSGKVTKSTLRALASESNGEVAADDGR